MFEISVTSCVWQAEFYQGVSRDENKIFKVKFNFKDNNSVEIIKIDKNIINKYTAQYKFLNNEVPIFDTIPDYPCYIFLKKENNWDIVILGTYHLKNLRKLDKNKYVLFIKPSINKLIFRTDPNLHGKFMRFLEKGEKLELLEAGETETINGVKGSWIKVKTKKNEVGWCFSGYLDEWTDEVKK